MRSVLCPSCGRKTKKFGLTKAGTQRYRCTSCMLTFTHSYSTRAKRFGEFLEWLMGKSSQEEMPEGGRSFRRRCSEFWSIWALAQPTGEICEVVYVDGIHIAKDLYVLVASSDEHVLGWYFAHSENAFAWASLLVKIPAPDMVVTDGGTGFAKAAKRVWPKTRVQRCLVHVAAQIRRYTTRRPKLAAGRELLALSRRLTRVRDADGAAAWLVDYNDWHQRWKAFLSEKTLNPETGHYEWTHGRLVRARNSLDALVKSRTLFTYLEPELAHLEHRPSTNNRAESLNASLREMLRRHRGLSRLRRVKAVFWWCYLHTEEPLGPGEILGKMPTDRDIDRLIEEFSAGRQTHNLLERWGEGIVWEELHHASPRRDEWDV